MSEYREDRVCVTPIGGLDEVGERNCYLISYKGEGVLLDCGQKIPFENSEDLGPEFFPDFRMIWEKGINILGILVSHAHIDHVGGLPYFYGEHGRRYGKNPPTVYAIHFTLNVIERIVFSFEQELPPLGYFPKEGDSCDIGPFRIEVFPVIHSIPQALAIIVHVGGKSVVYLGDCKMRGEPSQ